MSHWWSPRTLFRMEELKVLEKRAESYTKQGLPVPADLQAKISEIQTKLR